MTFTSVPKDRVAFATIVVRLPNGVQFMKVAALKEAKEEMKGHDMYATIHDAV